MRCQNCNEISIYHFCKKHYEIVKNRGYRSNLFQPKIIDALIGNEKGYETCREQTARLLHDTYEQLSKEIGWKTQDKCKVPFEDLPEKNKLVMLGLADMVMLLKFKGRT